MLLHSVLSHHQKKISNLLINSIATTYGSSSLSFNPIIKKNPNFKLLQCYYYLRFFMIFQPNKIFKLQNYYYYNLVFMIKIQAKFFQLLQCQHPRFFFIILQPKLPKFLITSTLILTVLHHHPSTKIFPKFPNSLN